MTIQILITDKTHKYRLADRKHKYRLEKNNNKKHILAVRNIQIQTGGQKHTNTDWLTETFKTVTGRPKTETFKTQTGKHKHSKY